MQWTEEMDRRLREGVAQGRSRGRIASDLGVSRFAAIARYNRIMGVVFQSAIKETEKQSARREAVEAEIAEQKAKIRRLISRGETRNDVIHRSIQAGARMTDIAECLGITRQAVHQRIQKARINGQ